MYEIDFKHPVHVFFVGIGGISMSGLARILASEGFTVSGSDRSASAITQDLEADGIHVYIGQRAENITDEIDLKLEMLECHISQLKWMRDHDGIDFAEFVKTCSRFRGLQSGVQYAEAFCQEMVWPKVVTRRLLP